MEFLFWQCMHDLLSCPKGVKLLGNGRVRGGNWAPHCPYKGVASTCMAANICGKPAKCNMPHTCTTGATGPVALPDEVIAHIARFVVWLSFQDYAVGPIGARAHMIGPNEGPNGGFSIGHIDLGVALSACSWCDKCMYYAVPLHR